MIDSVFVLLCRPTQAANKRHPRSGCFASCVDIESNVNPSVRGEQGGLLSCYTIISDTVVVLDLLSRCVVLADYDTEKPNNTAG